MWDTSRGPPICRDSFQSLAQCAFSIRNSILSHSPGGLLKPDCWRLGELFLNTFSFFCKHLSGLPVSQTRHIKLSSPAKSSGPFLGPKIPSKNGAFQTGPPQLTALGATKCRKRMCVQDKQQLGTSLIQLPSEELVALDGISRSVSRFCNSKNELKSGFPAPKCGPKNGRFVSLR